MQIKNDKVFFFFWDMITDMDNNEKLNKIVTELFIRGRNLNISLVFITQSYFEVPKDVRLNTTLFLLWRFQEKENFNKVCLIIHQILTLKAYESLQEMYCKTTFFLVIDDTPASDNPSCFRKNLLEII